MSVGEKMGSPVGGGENVATAVELLEGCGVADEVVAVEDAGLRWFSPFTRPCFLSLRAANSGVE